MKPSEYNALMNPEQADMRTEGRKRMLHYVFTTALEGGIGYWSVIDEYHWRKLENYTKMIDGQEFKGAHDVDDFDGFYAIIESSEEDWGISNTVYQPHRGSSDGQVYIDENTALRIDIDVIERGMNLFVDKVIEATKSEDPEAPFSNKYLRQLVVQWLTDAEDGDSDVVYA
jgi:hypothetical protein